MKKFVFIFLWGIVMASVAGCKNLSDKTQEQPGVISTIDLQEAKYIREVLMRTPGSEGKYQVEAGETTTTVIFTDPLILEQEQAVRTGMKQLKESLTQKRGRTANALIFVYPNQSLQE